MAVGKKNESNREQWLSNLLATIPENSRILDAGAGSQRSRQFCKHLRYVSQDFGEYDGYGDGKGMQKNDRFDYGKLDIVSDIVSIPEEDESFDVIMCIEVLEHLPNPILALKELSRLLKPNGQLILTAPFCSISHLSPFHFATGFNKYFYEKYLKEYNFEIVEITPNGNFFELVAQEIYRIPLISKRFSNDKPNLLELFCIYIVEKMLLKFSKKDSGSSEIMCFGFFVHACKRE